MMKKLLCTLLLTVISVGFVNAQAEINVQGNTINIIDGSATPNIADGTDFGQVNIMSSSAEQLFVIQNTGASALTISNVVTTNPLFQVTTTPASPVAAGSSTTVGITYNAPASATVTNAQLFIFNTDSDENPYDFNIRAEAIAPVGPEINVTGNGFSIIGNGSNIPTSTDGTDFGSIASGTSSSEQIFVIQNTGTLPLSVNPSFTTNPAFAITTPAASSVAAGTSTTIGITFNAPVTPGTVNTTLFISNGDSDENPYQINLTAISVGPPNPEINVTGNGLNIIGDGSNTPNLSDGTDFGQIDINTSSAEQFFIIQNTGTSPLSVNPSFTTDPAFAITTPAASSVAAGSSTTIGITFNAPGAAATVNAILFINNGDSDENPYQINLTAEAIVPSNPEINVTGNTISIIGDGTNIPNVTDGTDFGQITANTSSAEQLFVIQNTGNAPLTINPSVTSNPAFQITTAAASSVAAGGSTTIGITFNAPATLGTVNATLFITNSDLDENPYQINLTGESILIEPEIDIQGLGNSIVSGDTTPSVTDDTDFGQTDVDTGSVTHEFTILNTGNADLNLTGVPIVEISGSADFTVTQQPALTTIGGPAGSTTFQITFDPSSIINPIQATVTILNNDSNEGSYTFDIEGDGIPNEPEIDILGLGNSIVNGDTTPSTTDDTDYGQIDVTSGNLEHTFTISNTGTSDLDLTDPNPYITISGTNAGEFTISGIPSATILASGSTTFSITFNPSGLGVRTATISIANNDLDEDPYTFDIQGEGIDANSDSQLLITQYYEGLGVNDKWIEVKNISTTVSIPGNYYLVMFEDLNGTINGGIATNIPDEWILIPALSPGEVVLFSRTGATLPTAANRGAVSTTTTEVCRFTGNDIIAISTTNDINTYDSRTDILGTIGVNSTVNWGTNTSLIKGCGTSETPSITYDANQYTTLTLDEVNNASDFVGSPALPNLALGIQTVGPTVWSGSSWDNGLPGKTKQTIINGTYVASNGSFESCDLTIGTGFTLNLNGGTSNYVLVDDDLTINGSFIIGDTESLVMTTDALGNVGDISGQVSKIEVTTSLNNYRDFTYWSSPVNTTIGAAFTGVNANRIFRWDKPGIESPTGGAWTIASGSMTAGRGFIAEAPIGSTQHTVTFTGTPNNGLINMPVGFVNDGFEYTDYNLIGNPYPSAIDIDQFISLSNNSEIRDNDDLDGTIYLWTHSTQISGGTEGDFTDTDYATYNLAGGTASSNGGPVPTNNIGSGQGFMVRTKSSGTVFFQNDMRLNDQNTQFFKSNKVAEEKDRLWLDMTSEQGAFNQILVGFFDEATDGVDRGYDGIKNNGGSFISFYSNIDDSRYVIQGLGTFNQSKEVTLGFDTGIVRTFKIAISNIEGVLKDEDVYLVDNALNIVHDLKQSAYEFEITDTGAYMERFTLKFNNSVLDIEDLEFSKDFLVINEDNTLRIKANQEVSKLRVFDMLGRLLIDQKPNESDFYLNTKNIKKGTILILNATMQDGSIVSKKGIKY